MISINYVINPIWRVLGIAVGLFFAAVGGYSSQARMLGLKPFDNSYRKARESYKDNDDDYARRELQPPDEKK